MMESAEKEIARGSCVRVVFISIIFIHTVRKENFATQIEQKRVQQNEERFSRSQDNATLSNWPQILSNLGYFCEVRSIIVLHAEKFTVPIVALIIEQSRVGFIFIRTFLGTAASRGIFKIFTPQASQAYRYSCYKTKSTLRISISTIV